MYGRPMAKSDKSSASTWRRKDAAYRAQQKARRDANVARRLAREATQDDGELTRSAE